MVFRRLISKQLGELLMERGVINKRQLEKALEIQREKGGLLGHILVALGYASEEAIAQALTVQFGFPYLPLNSYNIEEEIIKIVPENVSRQYCLIPIDKMGDTLTIAMSNPLNQQAIEDIEMLTNCKVQVFVSTMTDVNNSINKYYRK